MDNLFWNKIFGAVLATALAVMGIKQLDHALVPASEPVLPGYKIALAEDGGGEKPAPVVEEVVTLAQMLAEASPTAGERTSKKCAACHDFTKGGPNKIGPNLWGVLGRVAGTHEGFKFSDAMKAFGKTWDYENLNAFVSGPKNVVPGTAMGFAGLKKAKDAANLLAYLRTLNDTPLPLPAVGAAAADEAAGAVLTLAEEGQPATAPEMPAVPQDAEQEGQE